jgi:glycosyltransferase involved in cell wall biosynthesis
VRLSYPEQARLKDHSTWDVDVDAMPTMSRRSVVFLITGLGRGGAEKQVAQVALRLGDHGWRIKGVISLRPLTPWAHELQAHGIPTYSLNMSRSWLDPIGLVRAWNLVRSLCPDVMVTFLFHASVFGAVVGRLAGVRRIVASVRNQRLGSPGRERIFRWSRCLWHATVVNSHGVAREILSRCLVTSDELYVIPNGIETSTSSGASRDAIRAALDVPDGTFVWLAVGSLSKQKEYQSLLRAVSRLKPSGTLVLIAGDGPLMPHLNQLCEELLLTGTVRFLGERTDIDHLLAACDAFVSASAWEGMPNAIMEALAAARPVVATTVGGVPELIEHGATGWLVGPGDPEALSAAMAAVMNMTVEERASTGDRARKSITTRYGWERVMPQWDELLQKVLTGRAVRGGQAS